MPWQLRAAGALVADWNSGPFLDRADPYLVWLDVTGYASVGLPPKRALPVIVEHLDGAAPSVPWSYSSQAWTWDQLHRMADPDLRKQAGIRRFEVAAGTVGEDALQVPPVQESPSTASLPARDRGQRPVVGFIDYGCAFAHRQFRRPGPDRTRVRALWDQGRGGWRDDPGELLWQRPHGFGYGAETWRGSVPSANGQALPLNDYIGRFERAGAVDEEACYRHSGYEPVIGRRATHGTHLMDLATGWPGPLRHLGFDSSAGPHDADIVFVQLPRFVGGREVAGLVRTNIYDAVRYIVQHTPKDQPAVINLSYGANAGPHDGTSVLESALDWRLGDYVPSGREPVHLVVSSGNARAASMHARADLEPGRTATFLWHNLPDDPSDSFVEIWLPRADRHFMLRVTAPNGEGFVDWLAPGRATTWRRRGWDGVAAALVYPSRPCQSETGSMALLAVAHTRPSRDRTPAPYGAWQIEVHNGGSAGAAVHAWCERDAPAFGTEGLPRQGCFSATATTRIDRDGTLNSIAHADHMVVVGGHALGGVTAAFSGTGPGRGITSGRWRRKGHGGQPRRRGPDSMAPCDESPAVQGLLAAAVIGTDRVRLTGTSQAAAVMTRRIIEEGFKLPTKPTARRGPARPSPKPLPGSDRHPDDDLLPPP